MERSSARLRENAEILTSWLHHVSHVAHLPPRGKGIGEHKTHSGGSRWIEHQVDVLVMSCFFDFRSSLWC